jgi:hypothetical protein
MPAAKAPAPSKPGAPGAPKPPAAKPASPAAAAPALKGAPAPVKPVPAPVAPALKPAAKTGAAAVVVATPKPVTPAPVLKPAAAPVPVAKAAPVSPPVQETVVEAVAAVPGAVAAKKPPVMLFAALGALAGLGVAGAFFMFKAKPEPVAVAVAAPVASAVSETELRAAEEARARMLAEELKTPRSFRNDRYSFEVSERGVLQKLVGLGNRTIIDEFGWLELQGMFSGTSKPFYAGTIGDRDYVPSINKTIRDDNVVFEITGRHPRFVIQTVVTCLPTTLRVETVFNPIDMTEARGPITGVYTVKMNRQSLSLGQRAVVGSGSVVFATQSGPVAIKFNDDAWGQSGEAGKQTFAVASNLVFFYFAGGKDPRNNRLTAELTLP